MNPWIRKFLSTFEVANALHLPYPELRIWYRKHGSGRNSSNRIQKWTSLDVKHLRAAIVRNRRNLKRTKEAIALAHISMPTFRKWVKYGMFRPPTPKFRIGVSKLSSWRPSDIRRLKRCAAEHLHAAPSRIPTAKLEAVKADILGKRYFAQEISQRHGVGYNTIFKIARDLFQVKSFRRGHTTPFEVRDAEKVASR